MRTLNKKLDEEKSRYENIYMPKIKETMKYQKELYDELEKIRQDADLLPSMFRAEAKFRKEANLEKDEALEKMNSALKQHNKLVKERDDLKNEVERKYRLAIQAIAARSNIK